MSSIDGKHWYRFTFLKSEKWESIRLECLVKHDAVCQICGLRDISNDVHHVWYNDPEIVEENQLTVLCRSCHEAIHEQIEPESAKDEASKGVALLKFRRVSANIQAKLGKCKSNKPCQACRSREAIRVNPVVRIPNCEQKGMSLCNACLEEIYQKTPFLEHGSNELWDKVKRIIGDIQKRMETTRSERLELSFNKPTSCAGIYREKNVLTVGVHPIKSIAVNETLRPKPTWELGDDRLV